MKPFDVKRWEVLKRTFDFSQVPTHFVKKTTFLGYVLLLSVYFSVDDFPFLVGKC